MEASSAFQALRVTGSPSQSADGHPSDIAAAFRRERNCKVCLQSLNAGTKKDRPHVSECQPSLAEGVISDCKTEQCPKQQPLLHAMETNA